MKASVTLLIPTLLVMRQGRGSEATEAVFCLSGKKASSYRGAYRVPSFNLYVCVCVTLVVFTDCESCTWPISTSSGSMESGEYRLTRGMRVFARCLEVVAVAGLMWVSWCVFRGAGFFRAFHEFAFSNS